MPARLLAEWMAYAQMEPFGPPAEFVQAGIVASQIYNANRTKDEQPVATPHDYLPREMTVNEPVDDDVLGEQNADVLRSIRGREHG